MTLTSEPRSRRERPAKPPLSREWIVEETVRIVREEGVQKATMRRVAQALDTGAASLYVYVRNTAELHAAVIDELVGRLRVPTSGRWRADAKAVVTAYRDVLDAHPGLARSALIVRPSGPHLLALFDRLMGLLITGGAHPASAAWGADLLLQTATATAAEHGRPDSGDLDSGVGPAAKQSAIEVAVRAMDPVIAPHLAAHADAVLGGTPEQRWTWALDTQITGITTTPGPA